MLHEPAVELAKDNSSERKAKLGVKLFWAYSLIYVGFVVIGTVSPRTLGVQFFGIANLAIFYGMGLIGLAILMGLFYNYFCTKYEKTMNEEVKL